MTYDQFRYAFGNAVSEDGCDGAELWIDLRACYRCPPWLWRIDLGAPRERGLPAAVAGSTR